MRLFCAQSAVGSSYRYRLSVSRGLVYAGQRREQEAVLRVRAGILGVVMLGLLPFAAQAGSPNVTVSKPWARYLLPNIPAALYMVLQNNGATDAVLTGASSPACGALMLHESEDSSGMAMMMMVQTLSVPAQGKVSLAPGGYHLMCMQPKMKLGTKIPVTLDFQDGSSLALTLPVYGPAGAP